MIVDANLSFKRNDSEISKTHWRISDSTNSTAKKTNEGKIQTLVKNFWFGIFLLQSATWIPLKDYKYILLKSASFHLQSFRAYVTRDLLNVGLMRDANEMGKKSSILMLYFCFHWNEISRSFENCKPSQNIENF